ncbi:MAG: NAD(P)/FAD-dependent oxidoreductase [Persicimonas sp.]
MNAPREHTECTVIGAGAAGISAACWLATFEVDYRWFAPEGGFGGILQRVHNAIPNYPGGCYESGEELIDALRDGLERGDIAGPEAGRLDSAHRSNDAWRLEFADRPALSSEAVILATGTRYRTLGVPGESEAMGDTVSQSATADAESVAGRHVAVVGGGDAGLENALILAEHDCQVTMLLRSEPKARPTFLERAEADDRIEFYPIPTTVARIDPTDDGCRLHLNVRGERDQLDVARLFVRIGVDPVLPDITPQPERTDDGFLLVDDHQRTDLDGLLAASDVTACTLRSVATATGGGARAARTVASH